MREAGTILETGRLLLREFRATDVDALAAVLSDPKTMHYYPEPFNRAGVEAWIDRNQARYSTNGYGLWAMVLKSSGEVVGDCGLVQQEVDGEELVEIGYPGPPTCGGMAWLRKLHRPAAILDSVNRGLNG